MNRSREAGANGAWKALAEHGAKPKEAHRQEDVYGKHCRKRFDDSERLSEHGI